MAIWKKYHRIVETDQSQISLSRCLQLGKIDQDFLLHCKNLPPKDFKGERPCENIRAASFT